MTTCLYCNGEIPEGAKFCTNCGAALPVEAPIQQPTFNQATETPYQQPVQPQPYQQPAYQQQAPKSATMLIVLSVLEFLFCGGLLAIIPLVLAIQAGSAYSAGNIAGGDAKAKSAKTALIVVLAIGIVAYVGLFGLGTCSAMYN